MAASSCFAASCWRLGRTCEYVSSLDHVLEVEMAFQMYSDAILTRDVPESGLRAGDIGTVVELHVVPGVPEEGHSVEFFDMTGNTVAVVTLPASALRIPDTG